jgi:putative cardiolipin synthase
MHNKLFIADAAFAIAGGRNIADEYFFHSAQGNFLDFDVLLDGPAVAKLENIFDQYWNSRWVYPLDAVESTEGNKQQRQAEFDARLAQDPPLPIIADDAVDFYSDFKAVGTDLASPPLNMIEGKIRVIADSPEKVSGQSESGKDPSTVTAQVIDAFASAHTSLLLVSPYFVPNEAALQGLKQGREAGVQVDIVTNSLAANDEPLAGAAYADYRKEMLKAGIGLYEISSKELKFISRFRKALGSTTGRSHAKLAVIDRHIVFVGSMNLDLRSSRLNTEMGVLVDSKEFATGVDDAIGFIQDQGCYRLVLNSQGDIEWLGDVDDPGSVYTDDPQLDLATRLQIFLTRPFVPDTLL